MHERLLQRVGPSGAIKQTKYKIITVSLMRQMVETYEGHKRVFRFECVTHDGKALHQYHGLVPLSVVRTARSGVSDWFGSYGCVCLAEADAKVLYGWAAVGTTIIVQ